MNNSFEIRRIQLYCKDNGVDISNEIFTNYFLFDDDGRIYKWNVPNVLVPNLQELKNIYSDDLIMKDIAMSQIRAYRNKYLRLTDNLIGDRIDDQAENNEIKAFRRKLRNLPANLDESELKLNSDNRINLKKYFNKKNLQVSDNIRKYIKNITDETDI